MEQVMYGGSKSCEKTCPKLTKIGLNGVPVARLGLILGEDGATASRKLSKHVLPLFPPTWGPKRPQNIEIEELGENIYKIPLTLPMKLPIHRSGRPILLAVLLVAALLLCCCLF